MMGGNARCLTSHPTIAFTIIIAATDNETKRDDLLTMLSRAKEGTVRQSRNGA